MRNNWYLYCEDCCFWREIISNSFYVLLYYYSLLRFSFFTTVFFLQGILSLRRKLKRRFISLLHCVY